MVELGHIIASMSIRRINQEYNLLTPLRNQGRFDVPAALIIYAKIKMFVK